ncbi:PilZ domain-containing protein [bacterium]|nr:PilZ domain-containing protein [bacterium]
MLDNSFSNSSPEIHDLITILRQKGETVHELRSEPRESVVFPATVQMQYELGRSRGFTKDVSSQGACLITEVEIKAEQIATLEIFRDDNILSAEEIIPTRVRARCTWVKPFGDGYYMTGWKFLRKVLQNRS